jgi:hypothetical protein
MRALHQRVVILSGVTPDEAAELLRVLRQAPATPAAQALDHMMADVDNASDASSGARSRQE